MTGYDPRRGASLFHRGAEVGGYVIEGRLGEGASADVYLGRHRQRRTRHALKVLRVSTASLRARLLREGLLQASLRHPNVVGITEVLEHESGPVLVVDYVPGGTLAALLERRRPTIPEADALARGILAGVAAAHERGLVHRDLKPDNVLLEIDGDGLIPRIADFGLAKALDSGPTSLRTRTGNALGTPLYAAPEQLRDAARADARADVFALGAILYELVTGRRAFEGDDLADIYLRVRDARYTPTRALEPDLDPAMDEAIRAALSKDPVDRPAHAGELLARWVGERPAPHVGWDPHLLATLDAPLRVDLDEPRPAATLAAATWVPPPEAPRATRRVPGLLWGLSIAVLVGVLVSGAMAALRASSADPTTPTAPDTTAAIPVISDDPQLQAAWALACGAYLDTYFSEARRQVLRLERQLPDQPDVRVLGFATALLDLDPAFNEELAALDRVAAAHAGPEGERARMFARYLDGDRATWERWLTEHPEDWVAATTLPLASSWGGDDPSRYRWLDGATARWPDAAVTWLAVAAMRSEAQDEAGLRAAVERGLARSPDAPRLLHRRAQLLLANRDLDGARRDALAALAVEPGMNAARIVLAGAAIAAGDEAEVRRLESALRSPEVPASSNARFLLRTADAWLGVGRFEEADRTLVAAIEAAAGDAHAAYDGLRARMERVEIALLAERPGRARERWNEFEAALGSAEDPGVRQHLGPELAEQGALLAALEGDLATARAALPALEELHYASRVAAAVATAEGGAVAPLDGWGSSVCDDRAWTARLARRSRTDGCRSEHEAVLGADPPCLRVADGALHRVDALAWLALDEARSAEPEVARAHLAEARALWPAPDADLPAARRLAEAEALLATSP